MNADDRFWCEAQIQRELGAVWRLSGEMRMPSRTGTVFRLTATDQRSTVRHYFLKRFDLDDDGPMRLADRLRQLTHISSALQQDPTITPYLIVAVDPERRLLLSHQVEGQPILALHRSAVRSIGPGAASIVAAWGGVGRWLSTLHKRTLPTMTSHTRAEEIETYTLERLSAWSVEDPGQERLITNAIHALRLVAARCSEQPLTLTPCHGDVSGFNILVSRTVGLIDFDDLRFDFPGLDLSQTILELRNICRVFRLVPLWRLAQVAQRAIVTAYGDGLPDGAHLSIQHYRNLAVIGLTLARRRRGVGLSRLTDELHYRRSISDLRRLTRRVLDSGPDVSVWKIYGSPPAGEDH